MSIEITYTYLCTVNGSEYVNFYREHLNSRGIYVKLVFEGDQETEDSILFFVADKMVPESINILMALNIQDNLSFDPENEDLICPNTPYLDTITEEARWHRNRIFMFKPNGPYDTPGTTYTDWKEQDIKKKTMSISLLMIYFGIPSIIILGIVMLIQQCS